MKAQWTNWAGTASASPHRVEHPASTDAIAHAITSARADGRSVRPRGSGHSFSEIAVAPGGISGSTASFFGLSTQRSFFKAGSRFLAFDRAVTATTSMGRPQRAASSFASCAIDRTTDAPTVPRPATPTLREATMNDPE